MATYHITTPQGLQDMNNDLSGDYILDNDLDMTGFEWTPIMSMTPVPFSGTFDGQNHTISNLTITDIGVTDSNFTMGFIGYADSATIQNINFDGVILNTENSVSRTDPLTGVVAGQADGCVIKNCKVKNVTINIASVSSYIADIGGLIGYCGLNYAETAVTEISDCSVDGVSIIANGTMGLSDISGFVGMMLGDGDKIATIQNCSAKNVSINLTSTDSISDVGGLIGYGELFMAEGCYAEIVEIVVTSDTDSWGIAGLIGEMDMAAISECYCSALDITLTGLGLDNFSLVGGLIGSFGGESVKNCYCDGSIVGNGRVILEVGGFAGSLTESNSETTTVENCYSDCSVDIAGTLSVESIAGFLGDVFLTLDDYEAYVTNCYSVGTVTAVSEDALSNIGGLIGEIYGGNGARDTTTIDNCAWYTDTSTNAVGLYYSTDTSVATLNEQGWGTDEPDNTKFYSKTHAVYAEV